jgi:Flp pilus assembly pilin Flp
MRPFEIQEQEDGQGLVEYALILIIVSVAAVLSLTAIGVTVTEVFFEAAANAFP